MSPSPASPRSHGTGFPRVSGDEPDIAIVRLDISEFSPRERG